MRTPVAVVYIHGYSATRQEVSPLPERLADALGANLFLTRLTGHGRDGDALVEASADDWKADALEAVRVGQRIGERVVLLSTSTGGTLSTWLAARQEPAAIAALVMISPNFAPRDTAIYALRWPLLGPALLAWLGDSLYEWQPANELQARYWTWRYPYAALAPLVDLMNEVEGIDKGALRVPALMVYSPLDEVVDPAAIAGAFEAWGGTPKRLFPFTGADDRSQHVLAGDIVAPAGTAPLETEIRAFLAALPEPIGTAPARAPASAAATPPALHSPAAID